MRLNRLIASRGVASRRACDLIIKAGRVRVNGVEVESPGTQVTPGEDVIEVDGRALPEEPKPRYVMLNKPAGVIVAAKDTRKRKPVTELVPASLGRLFPVGRLDLDTEGLLLLTNDGELSFKLTHPSFGIEKVYEVLVRERPTERCLDALREGVDLGEGSRSSPAKVRYAGGCARGGPTGALGEGRGRDRRRDRLLKKKAQHPEEGHLIIVTICEGKKRQVRRMSKGVGLTVLSLRRTALGPLQLGDLAGGSWRELTGRELEDLRACVGRMPKRPGAARDRA